MDKQLYWITETTKCPECQAPFGESKQRFHVHNNSLYEKPLPIWTCSLCKRRYIQYVNIDLVKAYYKIINCWYLPDLDSYIIWRKKIEKNVKEREEREKKEKAYIEELETKRRKRLEELEAERLALQEKNNREAFAPFRYLFETYDFGPYRLKEAFKLSSDTAIYAEQNYSVGNIPWQQAINDEKISEEQRNLINSYIVFLQRRELEKKAAQIQEYFKENYKDNDNPLLLDAEQALAIALDKKRVLVSARAGSGKTRVIASKILYLLDHEKVPEDAIISLSFNRNVQEEVSDRINKKIKYKENPERKLSVAKTFHKLAYRFAEEKNILKDKAGYIQVLLEDMKNENPSFKSNVYEFFRNECFTVDRVKATSKEDFYNKLRNHSYRTLRGDMVRSLGEKWIADFFFEHEIEYKYEITFFVSDINLFRLSCDPDKAQDILRFLDQHKIETDKEGIYKRPDIKPDFYLPRYQLVLEHWGINENETDPEVKKKFSDKFEQSWEEYYDSMQWKRKFWSYSWKTLLKPLIKPSPLSITDIKGLLETSVVDMENGRDEFEKKLVSILLDNGIIIQPVNRKKLVNEVWNRQVSHFSKMMEIFINKYQQCFPEMSLEGFGNYITQQELPETKRAFADIGYEVLKKYEQTLASEEKSAPLQEKYQQCKLDFNQLMVRATQAVKSGSCDDVILPLKYLLVDEYQDFSALFYNFIRAILVRNPDIQLFCVGDSWQAINRFMGANTDYFDNFKSYFPDAYETSITTNYRSFSNIVIESNRFMEANGISGTPAKYTSKNDIPKDKKVLNINKIFVEYRPDMDDYYQDQKYTKILFNQKPNETPYLKAIIELIKANFDEDKSVLILSRNNTVLNHVDIDELQKAVHRYLKKEEGFSDEQVSQILFKTIHKSKGDEADLVIILETNQGKIPLIHPDNELYTIFNESQETALLDEIRLFYVAITRPKKHLAILYDSTDVFGNERPSPFIAMMKS